jgi:hypothetical protein
LDKAASDFCECSDTDDRKVPFHGLKDGVVVLCHHDSDSDSDCDYEEEVEVSSVYEHILKVSVRCPSQWSCAVVDA